MCLARRKRDKGIRIVEEAPTRAVAAASAAAAGASIRIAAVAPTLYEVPAHSVRKAAAHPSRGWGEQGRHVENGCLEISC